MGTYVVFEQWLGDKFKCFLAYTWDQYLHGSISPCKSLIQEAEASFQEDARQKGAQVTRDLIGISAAVLMTGLLQTDILGLSPPPSISFSETSLN